MSTPVGITPSVASAIKANLKRLETSSRELNKLSDLLTVRVAEIEAVINGLNLGIKANVRIESWDSEDGMESSVWRLAYGKESGKWGFVIEYIYENLRGGADSYERWPFKDSPREQRINSIPKIPGLIEALVKKSDETAEEISRKVSFTQTIAATLSIAKSESGEGGAS